MTSPIIQTNFKNDLRFIDNLSEKANSNQISDDKANKLILLTKEKFPNIEQPSTNVLDFVWNLFYPPTPQTKLKKLSLHLSSYLQERYEYINQINQSTYSNIPLIETCPGTVSFKNSIPLHKTSQILLNVKSKNHLNDPIIFRLSLVNKSLSNYTLSLLGENDKVLKSAVFSDISSILETIPLVIPKNKHFYRGNFKLINSSISYSKIIKLTKKLAPYIFNGSSSKKSKFYKLSQKVTGAPFTYYIFDNPQDIKHPHVYRKLHQKNLGSGHFDKTLLVENIQTHNQAALQRSHGSTRIFTQLSLSTVKCCDKIFNSSAKHLLPPFYSQSQSSETIAFMSDVFDGPLSKIHLDMNQSSFKESIEIYNSNEVIYLQAIYQMVKALKELHQLGYAHRDLHRGNYLYKCTDNPSSPVHIVLIDFDFAEKLAGNTNISVIQKGNLLINPRLLKLGKPVSLSREQHKKVDIYALLMEIRGLLKKHDNNIGQCKILEKKLNKLAPKTNIYSIAGLDTLPTTEALLEVIEPFISDI